MVSKLKREWREFRRGQPGRRFQERYERKHRTNEKKGVHWRILQIALAIVLLLVGVVLVFIPGPAILFFAIGGSMLATQSLALARLLDWTEVQLRRVYTGVTGWWKRASTAVRGGVVALGAVGIAMMAYLAYQVLTPN